MERKGAVSVNEKKKNIIERKKGAQKRSANGAHFKERTPIIIKRKGAQALKETI